MKLIDDFAFSIYDIARENNKIFIYQSYLKDLSNGLYYLIHDQIFKNFISLVIDNNIDISEIYKFYNNYVQRDSCDLTIRASILIPDYLLDNIKNKCSKVFNAYFPKINLVLDNGLISGFIACYKDKRIDCSILKIFKDLK